MGRLCQGGAVVGALILVGWFLGPHSAAGAAPTDRQLAELLEPIRKKHDLPALAAAMVNRNGAVALAAVGVRKRGDPTPVTVADQFHLGSDTKAMTAVLLALDVEKGLLKWDDTLAKLFPGLAGRMTPEVRKITVEDLLTHHAGFGHDLKGGWWSIVRNQSPRLQRQEVLRQIAAAPLEHAPGSKYEYSNLGYTLAGHVAEKLGGADWEVLIAKKLFLPLGMTTAGFGPMGTRGRIMQPWQHKADGTPIDPDPNADNPPVMGPAGRVHCSVSDWAKFVALVLRQGRPVLVKPATFEQLFTTPFKDSNYLRSGWDSNQGAKAGNGRVLWHDGSNTQNYCTAWVAPDRDFAVLVATNQGGEQANNACAAARGQLIEKYLSQAGRR